MKEQVLWFMNNEDGTPECTCECGINEEELAINKMSVMLYSSGKRGRYILGYSRSNGERKEYKNSRQII